MTITRHPRQKGGTHTCNHRHAHTIGRRFGDHARAPWQAQHTGGESNQYHLLAMLDRMMAKIEDLEQRIEHLQHETTPEQQIVRRPRYSGHGRRHNGNHVNEFGRKMGSMSRHAWRDRHPDA